MKISVVIPVFNAEARIKRALLSVLEQKEVDDIILVDDGSSDNSFPIIQELSETENRIKIHTHKNRMNKGPAATRNLGIHMAKNEYVAFLDADDYYLSNRFKESVTILTADASLDGVYCKCGVVREWTEGNAIQSKIEENIIGFNQKVPPKDLFFSFSPIGDKGRFNTNSLLVRKSKLLEAKCYDENLRIGEDVMLYLKLCIIGRLAGVNKVLCYRTKHGGNLTAQAQENYNEYLYELFRQLVFWSHPDKKPKHQLAFLNQLIHFTEREDKFEVIILYLKFILKNIGFYLANSSLVHLKLLILLLVKRE